MAVLNAQYKHPNSAYSQGLKDLIDSMLKINPAERPDIHKVNLSPSCLCLNLRRPLGHSRDGPSSADPSMTHEARGWRNWCIY